MRVLGKQRRGKTFIGKNEVIGRPAKFDRTAAEPLKFREVRVEHVGQGYFGWMDMRAGDLAERIHHDRDRELGVLRSLEPRNANEPEFDDEVMGPSRKLHANGFVHDPAIARKEPYRLAKILRRRGDIEKQPRPSGTCLRGEVETERSIVERVCSKLKEPGLSRGRYAILAFRQIALGQAYVPQQGRRINIVIFKRSNRLSRGQPGRGW